MEQLINPHVLEITPYKPGKPVEEIEREFNLKRVVKLASNENLLPIPERVREAIRDELGVIHMYPDSDNFFLRQKLAAYHDVSMDNLVVGAGSTEIIKMLLTVFLKPGETVLSSEKTFPMYKIIATELAGKKAYIDVPMDAALRFDLAAIRSRIDERTKVIFLTNPNNPTGTMHPRKPILDFIAAVPAEKIVVLDNAYQEYVDDLDDYADCLNEVKRRKNLIVLRTFSKVYGLAGLRVGYALAHEETSGFLNRVKPPFNVTRVAQRAAIASLESDDFKIRSARLNRENKAELQRQLEKLGLRVIPSQTNFLLFFPAQDVNQLNNRLLREGVIVRPMAGFGVPDAIRVTVGLEEDNSFFLEKLKKVLAEMKKS